MAKRPLCAECRRQRRCEQIDGKPLCRDCRRLPDLALMRTLFDRARDGAVE